MSEPAYPSDPTPSPALLPRIGVTIGDPAGIGPEITLRAIRDPGVRASCIPVVIGDARYLARQADMLHCAWDFDSVRLTHGEELPTLSGFARATLYDLGNLPDSIEMGREQAVCGRAAGQYIETAVRLCQAGFLDGLTTAPINKAALHLGGYPWPGHTEFLAALTATEDFAMSFTAPGLRVALLTTHLPLAEAIRQVTRPRLEKLIRLTHRELTWLGFNAPRMALAAINPHGGEGGLFGHEEATEMLPAVESCRAEGIDISGPFSGDTIFVRAARGEFDIVLSCYHDQGLIPVKCLSFGQAVNVTLGLPFVRTSVDHGTAFDIAGQGIAEYASMTQAIRLAADLVRQSTRMTQDRSTRHT
ncbi:MAG: 4-hydroxythreonine-4-phosphate dehydrogenase PdxA [Blastocatellia bacterium]